MSKRCYKCKEMKELHFFNNLKKSKDGKCFICRQCRAEQYKNKRSHYLALQKKWDSENKEYKNEYNKKRRKTNPHHKMRQNLSSRLWGALHGRSKSASTMELLGCDIDYFVNYIKFQLQPNMTLDNIEIDHMMPCASFDLTKVEEQKSCFHYTNLQPLSKHENGSKGAKIVYDMIWRNNQWYIRDNPNEIYRSRANILPVTLPVLNLSNNSVQITLLDEITAMSKKIEERLNKINILLL